MEFKDYYKIMGVERDATQDEIKRSYRRLARKYHPDVSKAPDAEDRFKEVGEAYEVLKDPEKRAAYDQLGANWKAGQEFHAPPDWDAGFEFSGGGFTAGDASAYSDFFETLFGQGFVWIHRRFTIRAGQTTTLELRLRPGVQRQLVFPVPRTPGWDDVRSFQVEVVSADGTVHIEDSVESVRYWPHPWWPSLAPGSYAIRVKTDRGRTLAGAFVVEDLLPRLAPIRIPLR